MGCLWVKPMNENRYIRQKNDRELNNVTLHDTITYFPPITSGKVVRVYDGDTIYIASNEIQCPVPNKMFIFTIRIKHIDTPELRTKNEEEKELAKKAKKAMEDLVLNKFVTLEEIEHETKWGRILAVVKVNGINVSDVMLKSGNARPYEGGHKNGW
jgi:endonuclease YncB( thermonuclease family)